MTLKDERGTVGQHPLTPSLRSRWEIVKFDMPEINTEPKEKANAKKERKKTQKQAEPDKTDEEQENEE